MPCSSTPARPGLSPSATSFTDSTTKTHLKARDPTAFPPVRTTPAMDCDSPATPAYCDDAIAILNELDSGNDGSISDVEEDQEAFYAVFPQAPTLAKHHALRPLVDALRKLIAKPTHLFAALLPRDLTPGVQDVDVLERRAHTYTQTELTLWLSTDAWKRISDFLTSRSKPNNHDHWASPQLEQQVDAMMLKLALYYSHMWMHTCVAAVRKIHSVEWTVFKLHAEWSAMATVAPKLPALEATSIYRPLRLRSHTAAAALAATSAAAGAASTASKPVAFDCNKKQKTAPNNDAKNDETFRRARLARTSNEFLIAWFLHHKAKPYPSQAERLQIANKTGLTEQQVRNWFANMRKRHWKPKDDGKTKTPRCLLDTLLRKSEPTTSG